MAEVLQVFPGRPRVDNAVFDRYMDGRIWKIEQSDHPELAASQVFWRCFAACRRRKANLKLRASNGQNGKWPVIVQAVPR